MFKKIFKILEKKEKNFSNLPYVRCTTTLTYEPWAKHQLAYWHNKNNFLIENDNRVYSQFLSHIKNLN